MLSKEDNELLCRVEGDAPMGQLMRKHWIPALLCEEVAEPDGKPVRVGLLGHQLVAFRDSSGKLGVLDELCPHRKASLVYGRNEDDGLRCLYHGWKFDADGNCTDMSSEPPESTLCEKVKHKSWPHTEWGGFVWMYLGDEENMPEFQPPPFAPKEDTNVSILKIKIPCNWAQITEGQIDSAHSSSLHSSDMVPARVESAGATEENWLRPSTDKSPRLQVERTDYGFRYAAIRRPIKDAATHEYVRMTVYVAPFFSLIPPNTSYNVATVIVPIDDENTTFNFIAWGGTDCPDTETWRKFARAEKGVDVDADYNALRTLDNDFLQDRQAMKEGNFTGIAGIPNQDIAMWTSMGPLVDRSEDVLGASDLAIVEFRKLMSEAAKTMRDEGKALGSPAATPQAEIASYQEVIPKTIDWRDAAKPAA
ncbi:MAG: Rieske 2Fe-2S domain-containing protein [Alphaproteobacteria bacterium]|jgi:phthalate 4,5-dioxygenase|nr:Rieske 2Fe-2S domain-containing protein [Alphaproteobacteria bacterium]MBT4083113.1 Rieske 2Fe-2S domain-containing protein [Alphaproteobacteria bacterium]MBT4542369.1 Rieske 2Fe-2S domain-containing protein [Alphaproteobacteria bacterium]MBT5159999.1 Rieske 2Fe-2S domain-containing protein [Alphaproteobacteria bacterium]MBT7747272.1 Rieske 2Fe-2S domain-containing protein [Alphaproteobacteria bacterium]